MTNILTFKEWLNEEKTDEKWQAGKNLYRDNTKHRFNVNGNNVVVHYDNMYQNSHEVHFDTLKGRKISNVEDPKVGIEVLRHVKDSIDQFIRDRKPNKVNLPSRLWQKSSKRHKVYANIAKILAKKHGGVATSNKKGDNIITFSQNDPYAYAKKLKSKKVKE